MPTTENEIYLLTCFDTAGKESERLVSAASRAKATFHAVKINKASASDVARVMAAGGTVEEAE